MIKKLLPLFVLCLFSLTATAQFWKKKPGVPRPQLAEAKFSGYQLINVPTLNQTRLGAPLKLARTQYNMDTEEAAIMKLLCHNLHFHKDAESVAGFNNLVNLYLLENRFSEAKWYLLQSNAISHQQNDDAGIITSLVALGMVKAEIGDYIQAKQDLLDARDFASVKSRPLDIAEINKKLALVENKRILNNKAEIKYAELAESKN